VRHLRRRCEQHHHGGEGGKEATDRRRQAWHQATILWRNGADIKSPDLLPLDERAERQ
jgi:hypothetical protein